MTDHDLSTLAGERTVLLTTYKRDGTPVGTPVSIAAADGHVYMRTYDAAWKAKRLRRDPRCTVAPSTTRGKPTGPAVATRARLLGGDEAEAARRALRRKHPFLHGVVVPLAHRLKGWRTLHYELTPATEADAAERAA